MQTRALSRLTLISIGIALLFAGLFFDIGRAGPQAQATPTRDRLAEPTLPAAPSQADRGSQVYWLSCLPCHGDLGQGLTDEFRSAYPPEDRNCWNSGCHGERPYDNGFKLPHSVPAVIGPGALQKFSNAAVLYGYIRGAMPFWKPGSLTDEEAWSVTAFILRQNGLWDGLSELSESNAAGIQVAAPGATSTPPVTEPANGGGIQMLWPVVLGGILLLGLVLLLVFFPKKSPR